MTKFERVPMRFTIAKDAKGLRRMALPDLLPHQQVDDDLWGTSLVQLEEGDYTVHRQPTAIHIIRYGDPVPSSSGFKFALSALVTIDGTKLDGEIRGRSEYSDGAQNSYLVRYVDAHGNPTEQWFTEDNLSEEGRFD